MGWPSYAEASLFSVWRPAAGDAFTDSRSVSGVRKPDRSDELGHAIQERGPLPQQDRHTAAQVGDRAELAHDGPAVAEDVFRRNHACDRHRGSSGTVAVRSTL